MVKIEIYWLRKVGMLREWVSSTITWTNKFTGRENSIGIDVSTNGKYVRLHYTQTEHSGEKKDFDYKITLITTPCNYGGERYWFICPLYKGGKYCGRRVGVIYLAGNYFGCRHCYNLTYKSCNLSCYQKPFGRIISIPELERLEAEAKRTHYRGKLTKRYARFLAKKRRSHLSLVGSLAHLEERIDKIKGRIIEKKVV